MLNKADAVRDTATVRELAQHRGAVLTSTLTRQGLGELMERVAVTLGDPPRAAPTQVYEEWSPL